MKKNKLYLIVVLVLVACFAFAACAQAPTTPSEEPAATDTPAEPTDAATEPDPAEPTEDAGAVPTELPQGDWVLGIETGFYGNTWRMQYITNMENMTKEYKEKGIIKDAIITQTNQDITEQNNQLDNMLTQGVDALILLPASAESVASTVEKAKAQGVLVMFSGDPANYEGTYDIALDSEEFEAIYTYWIVEKLDGKGKIALMNGQAGNSGNAIRIATAHRILEDYPDIEIIAEGDGTWSQTEAQKITTTWLSTFDTIDGIIVQDVMADGILKAYDNANKPYPIMSGDAQMSFVRKWQTLMADGFDSIATPMTTGIGCDTINFALYLLNGYEWKDGVLTDNLIDPAKAGQNTFLVWTPFIITNDGKASGEWGAILKPDTKVYSVDQAVEQWTDVPDQEVPTVLKSLETVAAQFQPAS